MKVGVFAKTFEGEDPDTVLTACKAAGFDAVQYNMSCSGLAPLPGSISDEIADQIGVASDRAGVTVAAVSATYNMVHPDEAQRRAGRRGFRAIAAAAGRMGTNLVTVCTGSKDERDQWLHHKANGNPETWTEMCREFEVILGVADQHNLMIGVEPEQANVVSSPRVAARLLDTFAGGRLRIVLDPANILEGIVGSEQHAILDEAFDLLGPAIALAHAKDRYPDGRVAAAGSGIVDWKHFVSGLSKVGFDGDVIAHGISAAEAPMVARYLNDLLKKKS